MHAGNRQTDRMNTYIQWDHRLTANAPTEWTELSSRQTESPFIVRLVGTCFQFSLILLTSWLLIAPRFHLFSVVSIRNKNQQQRQSETILNFDQLCTFSDHVNQFSTPLPPSNSVPSHPDSLTLSIAKRHCMYIKNTRSLSLSKKLPMLSTSW